jgi:hypothetical protein
MPDTRATSLTTTGVGATIGRTPELFYPNVEFLGRRNVGGRFLLRVGQT